jgi:hypothetical protein
VKWTRIIDYGGASGKVYSASFSFKVGGRDEDVTDLVEVAPNASGANSMYASYVGQNSGFPGEKSLHVPCYGEEQIANWASYKNSDDAPRARAALVVRKGNVIWVLNVENCGVLSPNRCIFGPTPPRISEAQAVAELKRYAAKQKARVGTA